MITCVRSIVFLCRHYGTGRTAVQRTSCSKAVQLRVIVMADSWLAASNRKIKRKIFGKEEIDQVFNTETFNVRSYQPEIKQLCEDSGLFQGTLLAEENHVQLVRAEPVNPAEVGTRQLLNAVLERHRCMKLLG